MSGEGVRRPRRPRRPRVLIAGAGVAGLETLLALRAMAGDRVDITILAPEMRFLNRSMSVEQPFKRKRFRGIRLERIAAEFHARWLRERLDHVEGGRKVAVTRGGARLAYDRLVVALGARPERGAPASLTHRDGSYPLVYRGGRDGPHFRLLLDHLHHGRVSKLAFVRPAGPSWPLPLYDLALMTAADRAAMNRFEVQLSLITPEEEPLAIFGPRASAAIRHLLEANGVMLHTASYAEMRRPGWLDMSPGDRSIEVDRVVTEPRLAGPRLRGLPCDRDGFIPAQAHGRVPDLQDVFVAGDATSFPVKQGGLAAQQADAVAEAIAASVGIDIDPRPFRPILRGVLLTGGPPRYLRSDISGTAGDDSTISGRALWWPPTKLAGRHLAPYLSRQLGEAYDVMPHDAHAIAIDTELEGVIPEGLPVLTDRAEARPSPRPTHGRSF
ncbi:MAG: FAD-dependent oxidoreductase [Thermoleophilaceae bacterium]